MEDTQAPPIDEPSHVICELFIKKLTYAGCEIISCGTNHAHNGFGFEHNVRLINDNADPDKVRSFMISSLRIINERNKYRTFAPLIHVKNFKERFLN